MKLHTNNDTIQIRQRMTATEFHTEKRARRKKERGIIHSELIDYHQMNLLNKAACDVT